MQFSPMLLHCDENVPHTIISLFSSRGHQALWIRNLYGKGTPDPTIAQMATQKGAIVLTFDKHFFTMAHKSAWANLNVIYFDCEKSAGPQRAQEVVEYIEHIFDIVSRSGKRLFIQVKLTQLNVLDGIP